MNRLIRKQLTNILFVVLIVASALTIYLLSRSTPAVAVSLAAQEATPAPTITPMEAALPDGVPESVFLLHLKNSALFQATVSSKDAHTWTLKYGESPAVSALLLYTVENGFVSTLELTFYLPAEYKDNSKSTIEEYLYESSQEQQSAVQNALRAILADLLPTADAKSRLTTTIAHYWAEQALVLDQAGDDFEDTQSGRHFIAYRAERSDLDLLVCSLMFS